MVVGKRYPIQIDLSNPELLTRSLRTCRQVQQAARDHGNNLAAYAATGVVSALLVRCEGSKSGYEVLVSVPCVHPNPQKLMSEIRAAVNSALYGRGTSRQSRKRRKNWWFHH